jgi:6-hydroxymethylpterin diphosphokinase MptE-like
MQVTHLDSQCVVGTDDRVQNMAASLARGLAVCRPQDPHARPLAIVGSGPSLRDHLDEIAAASEVWAINGAYDHLVALGIVPSGFFGLDPLPGLADYVRHPSPATTFYPASTCDPSVLDALAGQRVLLWHTHADDLTYPSGSWCIPGGTTAVTRAPYLAHLLGYRDITIFGADSSFEGSRYCYDDGKYGCDSVAPRMRVAINGEGPFETELCLLKQVTQLGVIAEIFKGELQFKCGGLLDAYMRAPTMDDSDVELVMEEPESEHTDQGNEKPRRSGAKSGVWTLG